MISIAIGINREETPKGADEGAVGRVHWDNMACTHCSGRSIEFAFRKLDR